MKAEEQHGARPVRVVINVPILNEIQNIDRLVTGIRRELDGVDYVLLIVDDGSTDGTLEYLKEAALASGKSIVLLHRKKIRPGCQRGAALLAGLQWAVDDGRFDVFVEMDGDLSHRPEELRRGIEEIARGAADVAIASKYVHGSQITGRTLDRTLISVVCNMAVRTVLRWNISDYSNGYRFYNRKAAELIPRFSIRYGSPIYLSEVMALWLAQGIRVTEIPSHYVGRNEGWSKVRFLDYIKAGIAVLEIGARYRVFGFPSISESTITHESGAVRAALIGEGRADRSE
jgi:dolichol-phosphate mannosyltransferase